MLLARGATVVEQVVVTVRAGGTGLAGATRAFLPARLAEPGVARRFRRARMTDLLVSGAPRAVVAVLAVTPAARAALGCAGPR
jgi:hypothetical protein